MYNEREKKQSIFFSSLSIRRAGGAKGTFIMRRVAFLSASVVFLHLSWGQRGGDKRSGAWESQVTNTVGQEGGRQGFVPLPPLPHRSYTLPLKPKVRYTFGNCQRPVFSHGVSQHKHKITNLWKFELNWSSKLRGNDERKKLPCCTNLCAFR